jgi:hypothetical protein
MDAETLGKGSCLALLEGLSLGCADLHWLLLIVLDRSVAHIFPNIVEFSDIGSGELELCRGLAQHRVGFQTKQQTCRRPSVTKSNAVRSLHINI